MVSHAVDYPANLVVRGMRCLIVGGGRVATVKAQGLIGAGALVVMVAEHLCDEAENLAGVEFHRRPYRAGEISQLARRGRPTRAGAYRLVVAATSDETVNDRVCMDAEAVGVWACRVDAGGPGDFYGSAVLRRGRLTVAVSTGAAAPGLSVAVRDRLGAFLGEEYATLAELLSTERADLLDRGGMVRDADWKTALGSDMLELIKAGHLDQARERLHQCLS